MGDSFYIVKVNSKFSAAHALRNYQGKCESLHGHNFFVDVEVQGSSLDSRTGLLIDFSELKDYLNSIMEQLDHFYLNECPPFDEINPSSENLSWYIYQELKKRLRDREVSVRSVSVSENQNSRAVYLEQ